MDLSDLTLFPTLTLQQWRVQLAGTINLGQQVTSVSYAQGDGSKSVGYTVNGLAAQQAALARIERELRRRGVIATAGRPARRRIGFRF